MIWGFRAPVLVISSISAIITNLSLRLRVSVVVVFEFILLVLLLDETSVADYVIMHIKACFAGLDMSEIEILQATGN
jgi:hypothetical protein